MYYTAAPLAGTNNQIFLTTSTNGINWSKYTGTNGQITAVIPDIAQSGQYGIGQSTVIYLNGKFYHYYTNTDKGGEMLAVSGDGKNWYDGVTLHPVSQNDGYPVINSNNFVPTYLWRYNVFVAFRASDELTNRGLYYIFSTDGITWQTETESQKLLTGSTRGALHNLGVMTDVNGTHSTGTVLNTYYGAGNCCNDSGSWNIDRTYSIPK